MEKRTNQLIIFTAGTGMFLSTLDTGIINVALPTLVRAFDSSISMMTWTITLYTLALVSTIIIFGRIGDKLGRLRVYTSGLIVFFIASIACGLAISPIMLILSRALQGIGAAMLQSTAAAIISATIPKKEQGAAFGTLGMLIGLGPVLGPAIGGLLLSIGSWRWIFWINIPFIIFGLLGCRYITKRIQETKNSISINWTGNIFLALTSFALLWSISVFSEKGFWSMSVIGAFLCFIVFLLGFLGWERKAAQPILDLKQWKKSAFILPIAGIFVLGGSTSLGFIIPPYFLEEVIHLLPWQIGLINLSAPLGLMVFSNISGGLINKKGTGRLMIYGLVLMTSSYTVLTMMQSSWSLLYLVVLLFVFGAGAGTFMPANTSAIMNAASEEIQGVAGAIQRMVQNLGIAIYAAVASAFISGYSETDITGLMSGIRGAWTFAAVTLLIVFIAFLYGYRSIKY
ncbi:MFS transporter [Oceanobacillus sojae]|uniref:MFS transporter n=1 Tax=Oceanobacillus sojae TaxID=582851 RepID=UPI0021A6B784|nr:MFS transporter [Oceanobacillus sojae]MCT1901106.1 MFS transporter [Oceanobacillus sojae]